MRADALFPSNYIKAADLQGKNVRVTIAHVVMEDIGSDHKPVLYFKGKEKGLVLNKTNTFTISSAYGNETDDWAGNDIILFEVMTEFQGKSTPGIRVRQPRASDGAGVGNSRPAEPPPRSVRDMPTDDMDDSIPF